MIPISDTVRRHIGYLMCACIVLFGIVAIRRYIELGDTEKILESVLLPASFLAVLIVLLRAVPQHGVVWTLLWFGFIGSFHEVLTVVAPARLGVDAEEVVNTGQSPASLDVVDALAVNFLNWGWLWMLALLIRLIVVFPAGRPSSRLSRLVLWVALPSTIIGSVVSALTLAPWVRTGYADLLPSDGWLPVVGTVFYILNILTIVSLVDLGVRFRRSSGIERLQYRWVATAMALFVLSTLLGFPLYYLGVEAPTFLSTVALVAIPVSIGIAISKHRLFDIDLIISRTVLLMVMAALITLVYAGVVVGLGTLVGGSTLGWSIGVTALVAVLFEPVRSRAQRRVNFMVFGRRAAPYEVLADLTGRLAATELDDGLFGRMATRLAEGTGAERAIVWVANGTGFRPAAVAPYVENPDLVPDPLPARPEDLPGAAVPIVEDGETLGALSVEPRPGVTLTATERRLLEDLAGSVGLVMRRLRLDAELRHQASLLQESRRRLVGAQELERRRLQRRLDEDASRRVLDLRSKLDSAGELARSEGSERTTTLIAQMVAETDDAIESIEALVLGLHPPLLEAEGLGAAVTTLSESDAVDIHVDVRSNGRYPLPVEVAAYYCISEALTNALKHGGAPISVIVEDDADGLTFIVTDSGRGFDPDAVVEGSGLRNMADRVEPFGGSISVDTRPGRPTTISGRLPVTAPLPIPAGGLRR